MSECPRCKGPTVSGVLCHECVTVTGMAPDRRARADLPHEFLRALFEVIDKGLTVELSAASETTEAIETTEPILRMRVGTVEGRYDIELHRRDIEQARDPMQRLALELFEAGAAFDRHLRELHDR